MCGQIILNGENMVVEVVIIGPEKTVKKLDVDNVRVKDLIEKLGLLTSEYVVLKNDVVVTDEDIVRDGDKIVIYPVKSGG